MANDDYNRNDGERQTFNVWTAPASNDSPSLKALEEIRGDEEISFSEQDREEINRRASTFDERSPFVSNGKIFYP